MGQQAFDVDRCAELLRWVLEKSAFNRWLGLELAEVHRGEVELRLAWREEFGQYDGFLHAGVTAALLDTVCGFAAVTVVGGVLASQVSVRYLRPAVSDRFIARGRVIKPGRQQTFAVGELSGVEHGNAKPFATSDVLFVPNRQKTQAKA